MPVREPALCYFGGYLLAARRAFYVMVDGRSDILIVHF
jgi:hypothetical protein